MRKMADSTEIIDLHLPTDVAETLSRFAAQALAGQINIETIEKSIYPDHPGQLRKALNEYEERMTQIAKQN